MKTTHFISRLLAPCVVALFATGCPPAQPVAGSISGFVVKGPVSGARVTLKNIPGSFAEAVDGESDTSDDDGAFKLDFSLAEPTLEVCATGGTFLDEATGETHDLTSELCNVVRDYELGTNVETVLTPLTTLVTAYARCLERTGRAGSATAAYENAHGAFQDFLTIGNADFRVGETLPAPVTTSLSSSLDAGTWAGLLHAGLSQAALRIAEVSGLAPGNRVTSATLTEAIALDLSDDACVLDGIGPEGQLMQGDVALSADTLRAAPQGLLAGMLEFADFGRNASGVTASELRPILDSMARFESPIFGTITRRPDLQPPEVNFVLPTERTFTGEVAVNVQIEDESPIVSCSFVGFAPLSSIVPDFTEERTGCALLGSFNAAELGAGPLTLVVEARDEIGNLTRRTYDAIVDNLPPEIIVATPVEGSVVDGVIAIDLSAADDSGIVRLEAINPVVLDTTPANDRYTGQWDTTTVPEGSFTLTFEAEDSNGLISTLNLEVVVDNLDGRSFTGQVSLGAPIENAVVNVTRLVSGEALGTATSDNEGNYSINDASAYIGPVLVSVFGGEYTDVATGLDLPLATTLQAVIPSSEPGDDIRVSVNGLTSLAASVAAHLDSPETDGTINAANEALASHVRRPSSFDLLGTDAADLSATLVPLGVDEAPVGLFHAGLSRMAAELSVEAQGQVGAVTPDQLVAVLQADIIDGAFDGRHQDAPLSLSLRTFANSYTLRRSLAVATHLFVSDAPLVGVDMPRNASGILVDALRPLGSFYDDLSLNDDPLLFPLSAIPLPFDETPPSLSISFLSPHQLAVLGDPLDGDVRVLARATDGSTLASVTVVAPEIPDQADDLASVLVSFDLSTTPNVEAVGAACGVDVSLAPYSLLTDQVCACFQATDVLGNQSYEMMCFTRPPPTLVRLSPAFAEDEALEGDVVVEYEVQGGFGIQTFEIAGFTAEVSAPNRRRITLEEDYVDDANAPEIVVDARAVDIVGREATDELRFRRPATSFDLIGFAPNQVLVRDDLSLSFSVSASSGYPLTSCTIDNPNSNVIVPNGGIGLPGSIVAGGRICTYTGTLDVFSPEGPAAVAMHLVDATGAATSEDFPYIKDTSAFQSVIEEPPTGLHTNAASVTVAGTSDADLASATLVIVTPTGGSTEVSVPVIGDTFSVDVDPAEFEAEGTYSLSVTTESTGGQTHATAPTTITIDRTAPSLTSFGLQPRVQDMDPVHPKVTSGVAPNVSLLPGGPNTRPDWDSTPSFSIWSSLTDSTSYIPRYVVLGADNLSKLDDLEVRYRVGTSCLVPTPTSREAEAFGFTDGAFVMDISRTTSETNLIDGGTRNLCITALVTDVAGNVSALLSRQFIFTVVPSPVHIETESPLYDASANPLDFAFYDDDYENLFEAFRVPQSEVPPSAFCDSVDDCPGDKIPTGYAYLDAVVVNPWDEPVRVSLSLPGFASGEVKFRTRVLVVKSIIEAGGYWGSNPSIAGAVLRNPRHALADSLPSQSTQDNTQLPPNTALPAWKTPCSTPGLMGARFFQAPDDYPYNKRVENDCVSFGNSLVQNFVGRDSLVPGTAITEETNQSGGLPLTLNQGDAPEPPRFFLLEDDGTLLRSLEVPVQLPIDNEGFATLPPGARVVALWFDQHRQPAEQLFQDKSFSSPEMDLFCPLLNKGAFHSNGDAENGTLLAFDPASSEFFAGRRFGTRPIFKRYGNGFACGTFILSANSSQYKCTDPGARCYIDRSWREMTSIVIELNSPSVLVQSTSSGATTVSTPWSAPSHTASHSNQPRGLTNE